MSVGRSWLALGLLCGTALYYITPSRGSAVSHQLSIYDRLNLDLVPRFALIWCLQRLGAHLCLSILKPHLR
jgi:hypothetical protein